MPQITSQARAAIGGSSEATALPRMTVKAQTGMEMMKKVDTATPQNGQPGIVEDTASKAVTLSPQLTALARRQQKLQQEIQAQRDKEQAFEAGKSNFIPKAEIQAKLKQNKASEALKDLGLTYEELTQALLAEQQGADPVGELRSEIESLKKNQEDSVNKQYEATIKQYRAETDALIAADTKAFHLINKGKQAKQWGDECPVVKHIVETWEENPDQVLTVSQAAKEVEAVLRENAKLYADALKEIEPPAQDMQAQAKKTLPPPSQGARTLTNRIETAPAPRVPNQLQHLSAKERIAEAIRRASTPKAA